MRQTQNHGNSYIIGGMNKKTMIVLVALAIVIAGSLAYVLLTRDRAGVPMETAKPTDTAKDSDASKQKTPDAKPSSVGTYAAYDADKLADTDGTILLFFHAPWCPQCRSIEASIEQDGVPSGVTVYKVDYDSHQDLRQKYGVTIQTTFVKVNAKGEKLDSYVAYERPTFDSVEEALLR